MCLAMQSDCGKNSLAERKSRADPVCWSNPADLRSCRLGAISPEARPRQLVALSSVPDRIASLRAKLDSVATKLALLMRS